MKETSFNSKLYNRARYLLKQGYPLPTKNIDKLVEIMQINNKKIENYVPPANNYIPDAELK